MSGQYSFGTREPEKETVTEPVATKTCPRCGQLLFADMDVCYGCLYDFRRHESGASEPDAVLPALEEELLPEELLPDEPIYEMVRATPSATDTVVLEPTDQAMQLPPRAQVKVADVSRVALWIRTGDIDVSVPVPDRGLSIGREPSCDVVLHSQAVSRRHILVTPDPAGAYFRDLGSTNRALYQGRPIDDSVLVLFDTPVILCGTYLVPRHISVRE